MKQTYRVKVGKKYWFEYHCFESDESADAALWHRSHQRVTVTRCLHRGGGKDEEERCYNGHCAAFRIRFNDGAIGDAFEDELCDSRSEYCRPDPPDVVKNGAAGLFLLPRECLVRLDC